MDPYKVAFINGVLAALQPLFREHSLYIEPRDMRELALSAVRFYFTCDNPMKKCPGCQRVLDKLEFHVNRARRDGVTSRCKQCRS